MHKVGKASSPRSKPAGPARHEGLRLLSIAFDFCSCDSIIVSKTLAPLIYGHTYHCEIKSSASSLLPCTPTSCVVSDAISVTKMGEVAFPPPFRLRTLSGK